MAGDSPETKIRTPQSPPSDIQLTFYVAVNQVVNMKRVLNYNYIKMEIFALMRETLEEEVDAKVRSQ